MAFVVAPLALIVELRNWAHQYFYFGKSRIFLQGRQEEVGGGGSLFSDS
ncbi:MAG: hypothetical protein KDC32_08315 [Saprospiraceae bacterium]|nr:hypothetical protein [Saprospiraceae bacterium]